jgi:hypothetical protein
MSKRTLLIFVIPLILCLVGTFILLKLNQNTSTKSSPIAEITGQTNFLILQVDSLESESPEILAIWTILIRVDEPTYVVFKHISPESIVNSETKDTQISLELDAEGLPNDLFSQSIQKINLDIDSYFLLDAQGISALMSKYTGQELLVEGPLDDIALTQVCSKLSQTGQKNVAQVDWNGLIPLHMRTNLSFETFATIWEKLTRSNSAPYCEIIFLPSENQTTP